MRCAIYTRKSADERADRQLSTIERQRELCEAYIASQADQGWTLINARYDDPGYSGGTTRRPALKRLLADVDARHIDVIVVYKIDRLSRSLADFIGLVARFERASTSFVAITQSFDTASSMGRLTLNVLLSFAQFERELTSERLKDWFAGARDRGLWTSGKTPYGYRRGADGILVIDTEEAPVVQRIFRRYPALGSSREVAQELNRDGLQNHHGRPFHLAHITRIIRSRVYLGALPHKDGYLPGRHEPLVSSAVWRRANAALEDATRRRRAVRNVNDPGLLSGLVYDRRGGALIQIIVRRPRHTYRYYVPSFRRYGSGTAPQDRYRADHLEHAVLDLVDRIGLTPPTVGDGRPGYLAGAVRRLIDRIDLEDSSMLVTLRTGAEFRAPLAGRIKATARTR